MDNFKLNGIGKFDGGEYYDVNVNGLGTLNGDLNCTNLFVNGMFKSKGNIKAKEELNVNGTGKFLENVKCSNFNLQGSAKFEKNLEAESVKIEGFLTVEQELNVGNIEITSACFSIRELHADTILIHDLHKIRSLNRMYEIGEVECTSIEAMALKCKKIAANVVKLGKNVDVDLVEYTDSIDIDPRANIKEIRKI